MRLTFCKSLKTHVEKMSVLRLSMMLMKTRELNRSLHDVDENKGDQRTWSSAYHLVSITALNKMTVRKSDIYSNMTGILQENMGYDGPMTLIDALGGGFVRIIAAKISPPVARRAQRKFRRHGEASPLNAT